MSSDYSATIQEENNLSHKEYCSANEPDLKGIGRAVNQQVRIIRSLNEYAIYTVKSINCEAGNVAMNANGLNRIGVDVIIGNQSCTVDAQVPHPSYTDIEARKNSEFVERLQDNGSQQQLIVIAPHGGLIEEYTDSQAECIYSKVCPSCVSSWICKGWKKGKGTYDCWHITSTDIHEASFPKLNTVISRCFKFAVAFHGWKEDTICVSGSANLALLNEIKTAIENAIDGSGISVTVDKDNIVNENNIVNRLAPSGGIQIEQSKTAREKYRCAIADAVVSVLRPKLSCKCCFGWIICKIYKMIYRFWPWPPPLSEFWNNKRKKEGTLSNHI